MGQLSIHRMHYEGKTYQFSSPELDKFKVNIVEAPNGSGKSTFFDLIYYGLGGKVPHFSSTEKETHQEIVGDTSNFVELEVSLNQEKYKLIRRIGENLITILSDESILKQGNSVGSFLCLNINRHKLDDYIFSDWILERLNIPSIEIFHAGKNFKVGFSDLMRLMYHNQGSDVNGIYKPADNQNYVSDSAFLRKAIFEVLLGKTLVKLYEAYGNLKRKQSEHEKSTAILNEYKNIVADMHKQLGIKDIVNDLHLQRNIDSLTSINDKLNKSRANHLKIKVSDNIGIKQTEKIKKDFNASELEILGLNKEIEIKIRDIDAIGQIISRTREDAIRLKKIIHTHRQLEMFTPDTCPYCLKNVDRPSHSCVCGNAIDEHDYRRYFYDPSEYYALLKSKVKSLETMEDALNSTKKELSDLEGSLKVSLIKNERLKNELSQIISEIEYVTDFDGIEEIDDAIMHNKELISNFNQALILERNLSKYQKSRDDAKKEMDSAKLDVELLEASSSKELAEKVGDFNKYYNRFMRESLIDCRLAEINNDDYMPLLNNGHYKEASASVHKRFLYYVTLLQLSLLDDIPFPRFLMIDTPENIGIDNDNLKRMINCLNIIENPKKLDYQVILSTGVNKYPESMHSNVIMRLSKSNRLLVAK